MIPAPCDKPYSVPKKWFLKRHFQDLFQFPWNDAIIFLRFYSSVAWWKPAASPCIIQCHQIPAHFESPQSFITLTVCPLIIYFFSSLLSLPRLLCLFFLVCMKTTRPLSLYPFVFSVHVSYSSHYLCQFFLPSHLPAAGISSPPHHHSSCPFPFFCTSLCLSESL